MNRNRFKFMAGVSLVAVLAIVALLAGTHGAVSVASCDYCKVKTVAEVQSDSLDKIAGNEEAKSEMVAASDEIFIDKQKADKAITASFAESNKQVNTYAEKEADNSLTDADALAFDAGLFKRLDQTRANYELAANTLINDNLACSGSGHTTRHKQKFISKAGYSVAGTVAEGYKQLHGISLRSAAQTVPT